MNANDEPKNAGTLPFARKWNSSVPNPANRSVAETESPVSAGTSTVAPNMANMCCRPKTVIFGTPSGRASYTASGLSFAPMVGTGLSLIGKPLSHRAPARPVPRRPRTQIPDIILQADADKDGNRQERPAFPPEGSAQAAACRQARRDLSVRAVASMASMASASSTSPQNAV